MNTADDWQAWNRTSLVLFLAIASLVAVDIVVDLSEGTGAIHVIVEGGALLLASIGVLQMLVRSWGLASRARTLESDLASSRAEATRWRQEASDLIAGLGVAVERQFDRWELSKAEAEVALLLLKGLSLKEIAQIRHVSERTVRDQARAVYRKAGLHGRADLAAFFLEDLLLPSGHQSQPAAASGTTEKTGA
jgi:DNA-binding CsgD family transcriptional regulator